MKPAERGYRTETIGDFLLAKPTVMHANGRDYPIPAGRHASVGEISIVDGDLRRGLVRGFAERGTLARR